MYMIVQKCSLWKVAEVFFIEPTKTHYVKEISRKIELAHTSVKKHLMTLIEESLIKESDEGVFKGYKAVRENPEFIFHKKIANLIFLKESGLIEKIKEKYPKCIVLFGSYNKGEDIESSDIDIFVDAKKFNLKTEEYGKRLNRNIHLIFKEDAGEGLMESINQGIILFGEK